tara:strand:+ start:649 stop:2862 length:2214 start_codon:yes stop_codon:yes gene_type:complete
MDYIGKEIRRNPLVISGSDNSTFLKVETAASGSTAIFTNNIQNGYPTSNPWKENLEGSFFNNFDNTTHVSEILRFMSGVMSHSLDVADAAPNTFTFASVDSNENSLGSTDSISGVLPTNYTALSNNTLNYLVTKGFVSVGSTIFNGISVYHDNGSTYSVDFDSNKGGSSIISSSADSELFGLGGLTSGGATVFKVRVIASQSFSDNASNSAPDESSNTFTTRSLLELSNSSFGTSNGLTVAKINTNVPAVIPAAFQDGKFVNVGGSSMSGTLTRKYHASKTSFTSVSSSGYYRFHDLKVGIATGSSGAFTFVNGSTKNRFWAPVDQIESDIGTNSLSDTGTTHRSLTVVSRSLSGVPYMTGSTYELSSKITGLFSPMFIASTTLVDMTAASVGVGSVTITGDTVSTSGGTVQTSGKVFQSDGTTGVNSGVPRHDDLVLVTASIVYDGGSSTNIQQTGTSDSSFTVATKARNRNNSQSTLDTQTINYHTQGTFGQVTASGSLAVYDRPQGYDGGSLTGTSEAFSGEDFRIKNNNNVLGFNGEASDTNYNVSQSGANRILGENDLQVKPGFLVNPGGSFRYWYPANYGSGSYKYYIRRFQTSGAKTQMTLNVGKTLVNWRATTDDSVAAVVLFKSSASGSGNRGGAGSYSRARLYDPSETTSNLVSESVAHQSDDHLNPFTDAFDLYGNTGGGLSSTTYTIPLRNADGMFLDDTDNEFYVILRYKGNPSPVTTITTATS